MMQHPARRRATRVFLPAMLAALAAPIASPAQPASISIVSNAAFDAPASSIDVVGRPRVVRSARAERAMDTLSFAHSALVGSRIELVPALERMGAASHDGVVTQPMLVGVTAELRRARGGATVLQLLDRTASSLDAMCAEADGARRRSCRSMAIQLTAARVHLRAGRKVEARRALTSLAKHADDAVEKKLFEPWEGTVIGETAKYAVERV